MRWGSGVGIIGLAMVAGAFSLWVTPAQANKPVNTASLGSADTGMARAPKRRRAGAALVARINLSSQTMTVSVGGRQLYHWPISSGRAGYLTPRGSFRAKWAARMHYSRKYDGAPMPYAVFFNGGIATHGTNAVGRLGRPASHGCIRLHTANARKLYNLVMRYGYARSRFVVVGTTPIGRKRHVVRKQPRHRVVQRSRRSVGNSVKPRARPVRRRTPRTAYRPQPRMVWPGDRY